MIEGKGLGGKRINRVNLSVDNNINQKLNKLAIACNMKPTTLAAVIIEKMLNNPEFISSLQDEYGVHSAYRVIPLHVKGRLEYILNDGK